MTYASRPAARSLALAAAVATIGAAALVGAQASVVPINLKPGLWLVIGTNQPGGSGPDTSGMSDSEKKMAASVMQHVQQNQQAPHKDEMCIAKDQGTSPVFQPSDPRGAKCKHAVAKGTADSQDSTFECTGQSAVTGTTHVDRDTDETAHGTGSMTSPEVHMTMNYTFTAKWLQADCGKLK